VRRTHRVARGVLGARVAAHVAAPKGWVPCKSKVLSCVPGRGRRVRDVWWGVGAGVLASMGVASASSRHTSPMVCGFFFRPGVTTVLLSVTYGTVTLQSSSAQFHSTIASTDTHN
jgi:hypothetical protein